MLRPTTARQGCVWVYLLLFDSSHNRGICLMKTQPQQGHLPAENAAPTRGCMFAETQPLKGAYGLLISAPKGCVSLLIFCIKACIRICYYSHYRARFVCSFFYTTGVFVWCECWSRQTKEKPQGSVYSCRQSTRHPEGFFLCEFV